MPRSLERTANGSYKVLNGIGAVIDPSSLEQREAEVVTSAVIIDAVLHQLEVEGDAPDTVWLYKDDVPVPGSPQWYGYAAKLQALAECEVIDTYSTSRYVIVEGYGRFLTRK